MAKEYIYRDVILDVDFDKQCIVLPSIGEFRLCSILGLLFGTLEYMGNVVDVRNTPVVNGKLLVRGDMASSTWFDASDVIYFPAALLAMYSKITCYFQERIEVKSCNC